MVTKSKSSPYVTRATDNGLELDSMHDPIKQQRLAGAIHLIRPDWPAKSILTQIRKQDYRPLADLAVALMAVAVAANPASRTPARVTEHGPWWQAAQVANGTDRRPTERDAELCPVHGDGTLAWNCHLCGADEKATGCWPAGTKHHRAKE